MEPGFSHFRGVGGSLGYRPKCVSGGGPVGGARGLAVCAGRYPLQTVYAGRAVSVTGLWSFEGIRICLLCDCVVARRVGIVGILDWIGYTRPLCDYAVARRRDTRPYPGFRWRFFLYCDCAVAQQTDTTISRDHKRRSRRLPASGSVSGSAGMQVHNLRCMGIGIICLRSVRYGL